MPATLSAVAPDAPASLVAPGLVFAQSPMAPGSATRSLGHLSESSTPAVSRHACTAASATAHAVRCSWSGGRSGLKRIEHSTADPAGALQLLASRPRPSLWYSATT